MTRLKLQLAFATIFTLCAFLLVCLTFIYMVEYKECVERVHAIFGIIFTLCFALSTRILCQVAQEYHEAKDEAELV